MTKNQDSPNQLLSYIASPWKSIYKWFNQNNWVEKSVILTTMSVFTVAGLKIIQNWNVPRVTHLIIYPVKGCKGIQYKELDITDRGFEYDRKWMIVTREVTDDGIAYNFVTQRRFPIMATLHVDLIDLPAESAANKSTIGKKGITLWYVSEEGERVEHTLSSLNISNQVSAGIWGKSFPCFDEGDEASAFLNLFFKQNDKSASKLEFRLVRSVEGESFGRKNLHKIGLEEVESEVDFPDGFQYLLVSQQSVNEFATSSRKQISFDRFRPNIVVSGNRLKPYDENYWQNMKIGQNTFLNPRTCTRCTVPSIDQNTGKRDLEILIHLRKHCGGIKEGKEITCFGINLCAKKGEKGKIKVGDLLKVRQRKKELDYEPKVLE